MKDRLPAISIKLDTTPGEFLRRMEALARELGEVIAVREERPEGPPEPVPTPREAAPLLLKPIELSQHRGLAGRLTPARGPAARIAAEVLAARWNPEPPTYAAYVAAARELFIPLLRQYNRKYHARLRLRIASRVATEPRLPPMSLQLFNAFADPANKSALRDRDWQRLYAFIGHITGHNVHLSRDDMHRLLVDAGFSVEHAADLADIFEHGRRLLLHQRSGKM